METLSKLIQVFSYLILFICSVVLMGWISGYYPLVTFSSLPPSSEGMESMKPVTAICFITFAIVLILEVKGFDKLTKWVVPMIFICSVINLITYNTNTLLFFDLDNIMSKATAYIFIIGVFAFYLRDTRQKIYKLISEILVVIGFYLALFGLYGYIINYKALYSLYAFSSLSLPTTLSFLLLMVSIAMLHPSESSLRIFFHNSLGGFIARRLLLVAFFLPILVGFIIFKAVHTNTLSDELGIVIIVTVLSLVITLVGLNSSLVVHNMDKRNHALYRKTIAANHKLKLAENKLKKQNQRLRTINQYLDDFVHAVAHNLRGGVTNIKGLFEVKKDSPDFKLDIFDQKLMYSVEELDNTLVDLIRLIELQSKADYNIHEIKFENSLKKALGQYKDEVEKLKPDIHTNFSEKDSISYIPEYLESIFDNLLSNSLKYRQANQMLALNISTHLQDEYTVLKFSDNGIGIRPEVDQKKAFMPFRKLTSKGDGKGLGLFIVKSMVEKNGGKVGIESVYHEGTTIWVCFSEYDE